MFVFKNRKVTCAVVHKNQQIHSANQRVRIHVVFKRNARDISVKYYTLDEKKDRVPVCKASFMSMFGWGWGVYRKKKIQSLLFYFLSLLMPHFSFRELTMNTAQSWHAVEP